MQSVSPRLAWNVAVIVLLVVAAAANASAVQNGGETTAPAVPAVDKSWPEINLNVVVLDNHNAPQKVDERDFHLFEDGAERPLQIQDTMDSPVSVALVIHSSGSIFKRKQEIVSAVTAVLKELPADSEVMAVLFSDQAYLDLPFTPVSRMNFSFLDRLQANGKTTLFDAVVATEDHIVAHAKYVRRAMVILSDGEDNASTLNLTQTIQRIERPGAPTIYPCTVPGTNLLKPLIGKTRGYRIMKFLADSGGGAIFNLDPDPAPAAAEVGAAIRSQYVLRFTAADAVRNGKKHRLGIQLPVKDVRIGAPPIYYAPAN